MFWKKKEVAAKSGVHQCQVPGCGLNCMDEASLKRHMDWAHQAKTTPMQPEETTNPSASAEGR